MIYKCNLYSYEKKVLKDKNLQNMMLYSRMLTNKSLFESLEHNVIKLLNISL